MNTRRVQAVKQNHCQSLYYREKFGIHSVNFSDPALPRTAKESSKFLAQIIADNGYVEENMP